MLNKTRRLDPHPGKTPRRRGAAGSADVPAVDRAVRILQALGQGPLRLTEVARSLGLPKSTTLAILRTLQGHRTVDYDATSGRYTVGSGLFAMAGAAHSGLHQASRPVIERLARATGETVILHLPDDGASVVADREESSRQLRVAAPLGHRLAPFAGAVAKAMLAFAADSQARRLPRTLPRFTPRSLTSRTAYLHELRRTHERGYATDDEEYLPGVRAVSAPIVGADGRVVAVLSIVGVKARVSLSRLAQFGRLVRDAAGEISRALAVAAAPDLRRAAHG